jgi:glycosyltransferase involved in cell wall biosynthesis
MPGSVPGIAAHLKILIVTDAWKPQVNGVVRTLEVLGADLTALGHSVRYATPEGRFTIGLPTYREIRLAIFPRWKLEKEIRAFAPDAVHIATEGTLGMSARSICLKHGIAFSTSFHTRFPEYVRARFPLIPEELVYRWLRWFHGPATAMMVATESLKREMQAHGFTNLRIWSRGVDVNHFHPIENDHLPYERPVWLYVGRVAVEKNIEAFLKLDLPGTKLVVGDGPARAELEAHYPAARFLGALRHLRPGPAGGAGLRHSGGRLSGPGAPGRGGRRARGGPGRGPESGLPDGAGDRPPPRQPYPPPLRRGAFLAGLHPAVPAQYHRRAR